MNEVMNVGETILWDGGALSHVTQAGVEAWIESDTDHMVGVVALGRV